MSGKLEIPDLLKRGKGGADPSFYAMCNMYWSDLHGMQMVTDAIDPSEQFKRDPKTLPGIQVYEVHGDYEHDNERYTGKKIGDHSVELTMGSWIHETGAHASKEQERRFVLRLAEQDEWPSIQRQRQVVRGYTKWDNPEDEISERIAERRHPTEEETKRPRTRIVKEVLVGRQAVHAVAMRIENGVYVGSAERYGLGEDERDSLVATMQSEQHKKLVASVLSQRRQFRAGAQAKRATMPTWEDIRGSTTTSPSGKLIHDGMIVEEVAATVLRQYHLELKTLPDRGTTQLLHDNLHLARTISEIVATGMTSRAAIPPPKPRRTRKKN